MSDPNSFFALTLYEATKVKMESASGSNKENFRLFNESISKRFPYWKKIELRVIYDQEFQDKWVEEGRKWVLEGQKGFKKMEGCRRIYE